jgi:hypothetical protein
MRNAALAALLISHAYSYRKISYRNKAATSA